ncbi:Uncharacterized protein Adt_42425 [Abeliophyllum distichum]|uniref:Uncharacterized protein n=1 Tax=Abeliophyllum distichum TaxID=126358 RepID=A0ABD1PSH1_9LAMI
MGQMVVVMSNRPRGILPSNTEVNPSEQIHAITTRSGIQLPEIHIKRLIANKEKVPSTDEKHIEQTEQAIDIEESLVTPQVKAAVLIKPYEPLISFLQRLNPKKKK